MTDQTARYFFWLVLMIVIAALVYLLQPVLTPFIVAALIAYLGDPAADKLESRGLSRTLAVVIVFLIMTLLLVLFILLLVPMITAQVDLLRHVLPTYVEWLQLNLLPWLQSLFGIDDKSGLLDTVKSSLDQNWQQASDVVAIVIAQISKSSLAIVGWFGTVALVPVVAFYMMRDWDVFIAHIGELLPRSQLATITRLAQECDNVLGAFLRGQLLIMLCLGVIYAIGLTFVGLDLALLLGLLAGAASVVPYLGAIVGILAAGIAAMVQFHDWIYVVAVLAVFGVGQLLESLFLTPVLVGDQIGLHPVAVIFAVLAGGQLFGFVGVLLALPVAAVAMVIMRHLHHNYKSSVFYHDHQR